MKYYIRFATLTYLFMSIMLWWINQAMQKWTKVTILLKTEKEPSVAKQHPDVKKTGTVDARHMFVQNLPWRWQDVTQGDYVSNISKGETFCDGNFVGYGNNFAKLLNVVIDPVKGKGRRGGENISRVLNQPEKSEYYVLDDGYFALQCQENINYTFRVKSHLNTWQNALSTSETVPNYSTKWHEWTIAVLRYEYANLYHTMTDFYNAFLVAKAFKMQPGNITILWIDGHPNGALDQAWETLYGRVLRAGDIKQRYMFSRMVWGIVGYHSPLNRHDNRRVPYLDEFRSFFLERHGIPTQSQLNCAKLKITIIWRRDYLAHPRKPSGSLVRKIKNEDELLQTIKTTFPSHDVLGAQIDKFEMKKQLEMIANTDILVGMHGAGLSYLLFLPTHAGVVELFPKYWPTSHRHFAAFANWRNIHYLLWQNMDSKKELRGHFTVVNVTAVTDMVDKMVQKICTRTISHT